MTNKIWQTSRRRLNWSERTLVMGILNVTPDSFSDAGKYFNIESALRHAEQMIAQGADILDIGGESTRPNSQRISVEDEKSRIIPVIEELCKKFDIPISIDTTKSEVARAAIDAGAEIINDVSGLRWDEKLAEVAGKTNAGLILMHLRGEFETMHKQEPVADILPEVVKGFHWSINKAKEFGVTSNQVALDIGLGFSKTFEQNLELIARLDFFSHEFSDFPILSGSSRKSFIGKMLSNAPVSERLNGTLATISIAVFNGANIIRSHDVKEAAEAVKIAEAIKIYKGKQ